MKLGTEDYDKIIEILNRNPFLNNQNVASILNNGSTKDIANLFKEIRDMHMTDEAVSDFFQNNLSRLDPVLFLNGMLKSMYRDIYDQSPALGTVFETFAKQYQDEEMLSKENETVKYSNLYNYFAALIKNSPLPELNETECGVLLSLFYEISNFEKSALCTNKDFLLKYMEKTQHQVAEFLLKSNVTAKDWTVKNEEEFLKAFKMPMPVEKEDLTDKHLNGMQKSVAMFSLNPFSMTIETNDLIKSMISDTLDNDIPPYNRDINQICRLVGANISDAPLIAKTSQQDVIIVNKTPGTASKRPHDSEVLDEEAEIEKRIKKHVIIDMKKYKESVKRGPSKKKNGRIRK